MELRGFDADYEVSHHFVLNAGAPQNEPERHPAAPGNKLKRSRPSIKRTVSA